MRVTRRRCQCRLSGMQCLHSAYNGESRCQHCTGSRRVCRCLCRHCDWGVWDELRPMLGPSGPSTLRTSDTAPHPDDSRRRNERTARCRPCGETWRRTRLTDSVPAALCRGPRCRLLAKRAGAHGTTCRARTQETFDDEACATAVAEQAEDGAGLPAPSAAEDASDVASAAPASTSPTSAVAEATLRSLPAAHLADWRPLAKELMESRTQVVPAPAALEAADAEMRSNMKRPIEPTQEAMQGKVEPDALGHQEKFEWYVHGDVYCTGAGSPSPRWWRSGILAECALRPRQEDDKVPAPVDYVATPAAAGRLCMTTDRYGAGPRAVHGRQGVREAQHAEAPAVRQGADSAGQGQGGPEHVP